MLAARLIGVLEATRQAMRGRKPMLEDYAELLHGVHTVLVEAGLEGLAEAPFRLLGPINDHLRGVPSSALMPRGPKQNWATEKINLVWFALEAVAQAMALGRDERAAIRLVLPFLRRELANVTVGTVAEWRHEQQRQMGSRLPKAVFDRLSTGLPPYAGETPEARLRWLLDVLDQSTRLSHPTRR
jgi:hypothetical protein